MADGVKLHTKGRHCCGRNAVVEGDIFRFRGEGGSVGVVKITEPVNPMLNYFEYEILEKGRKCAVGLGFGEHSYPLDRMPGWNRNGIGYHADDGRMFNQDGYGKQFGPTCTEGDRMGCGIDFDKDSGYGYCDVFFTKNGEQVGDVVRMKKPVFGLYPIIGMHSRGEKVRYLGHWRRQRHDLLEPMVLDNSPSNMWFRSNNMKFIEDGLTLEYCGEGVNKQDVGIAQGNFRLDRQHHYFEMSLTTPGKEGWFSIGLASNVYPLHRFPGRNVGSVGYHAFNGHLYKENSHGEPFGPKCTDGDVMGCGIDFPLETSSESVIGASSLAAVPAAESDSEEESVFDDMVNRSFFAADMSFDTSDEDEYYEDLYFEPSRKELDGYMQCQNVASKVEHKEKNLETCVVYFTKNGERVGDAKCTLPKGGFYPVVAMLSQGENICVNFIPLTG